MPNQSVRCPSCGSAECQEYRADAFVCANCNSTFRWVNPMQMTVQQQSAACACGKLATAICTQCKAPICGKHQACWLSLVKGWLELKQVFASGTPNYLSYVKRQGGMANCSLKRPRGWLSKSGCCDWLVNVGRGKEWGWPLPDEVIQPAMKAAKLGDPRPEDVLCIACLESLFVTLLRPVELQILKLEAADSFCRVCLVEREKDEIILTATVFMATHRCSRCAIPVCGAHYERCQKCERVWCSNHWTKSDGNLCDDCLPKGLLTRLFRSA